MEIMLPALPIDTLLFRFAVAMSLGFLIGLQRQMSFSDPKRELVAGTRTYALIALLGATGALAAQVMQSPMSFLLFGLLLGGFLGLNYYLDAQKGEVGLTTEVSALLTFLVGAFCYWGLLQLSVALAVMITVLLSLKLEMQQLVRRITRGEMLAALKFAVISAVILPVLPDKTFGFPPFDVFNPFKIWLLVVFISGLGFVGFILMKVVGADKGIWLTGLLGGLASSTAVTLSFAQQSKKNPQLAGSFALGITLAWTVMFLRVLLAVYAVNPLLMNSILLPILASAGVGVAYCLFLIFRRANQHVKEVPLSNPFELTPAIKFGLLFSLILFISRAAILYLGDRGVYLSSLLAGLADVDAISLSVAELSREGGSLALTVAGKAVLLAAISNTFSKGMLVFAGGSAQLRQVILPGFLLMLLTAAATAWFIA